MAILDCCVSLIERVADRLDLDDFDIKFHLIDQCFATRNTEDLLLVSALDDSKYRKFISKILPSIKLDRLEKVAGAVDYAALEYEFVRSTEIFVLKSLLEDIEDRDISSDDILNQFGSIKVIVKNDFIEEGVLFSCTEEDDSKHNVLISLEEFLDNFDKISGSIEDEDDDIVIEEDEIVEEEDIDTSHVEDKLDEDMLEELREFSKSIVDNIIRVYNDLYSLCYVERPLGIMTQKGIVYFNSKLEKRTKYFAASKILTNFYNKFIEVNNNKVKELDSLNIGAATLNGELLYNYMPSLQVDVAFGIVRDSKHNVVRQEKSWGKYVSYLRSYLIDLVVILLQQVEDPTIEYQDKLIDLFTNSVIVQEFNKSKCLHFKYKLVNCMDKVDLGDMLEAQGGVSFAEKYSKVIDKDNTGMIRRVLYAFNYDNYCAEILFGYKRYQRLMEAGITPSANSLVIGRRLDGSDMVLDFLDRKKLIGSIMAGPRTGKGVLTLNIMAALLAYNDNGLKIPIIYADGKPEMSATLWEVERALRNAGQDVRILAIDGINGVTSDGVGPNRGIKNVNGKVVQDFGRGLPSNIKLTNVGVLTYLKLMQLYFAMARCNLPGSPDYGKQYARLMLILDETNVIFKEYNAFCSSLKDAITEHEPKGTGKNKGEETEEYKYLLKIAKHLTHLQISSGDYKFNGSLTSDILGILQSEGPKAGFSVLQIGQNVTESQWKTAATHVAWERNPFGGLLTNASWRILGGNSGINAGYDIHSITTEGMEFLGKVTSSSDKNSEAQRGYFVYSDGVMSKGAKNTVFKSYLTLNENDYNLSGNISDCGLFTRQLLTNISKDPMLLDTVKSEDLTREDGSVREEVGFLGLSKMLMSNPADLSSSLSLGYDVIWNFMQINGLANKYSCIEDYLVDSSIGSIYSLEELVKGVNFDDRTDSENNENVIDIYSTVDDVDDVVNFNKFDKSNSTMESDEDDSESFNIFDEDDGENSDYSDSYDESKSKESRKVDSTRSEYDKGDDSGVKGSIGPTGYKKKVKSVNNDTSGYNHVYTEPINMNDKVMDMVWSDNTFSSIYGLKEVSNLIMNDIKRIFGGFDRIFSINLSKSGKLVINGVLYSPSFDEEVVAKMPIDIQIQLSNGGINELFDISAIRKFRNLEELSIDSIRFAEGRIKRELGLSHKKSWDDLFKRFRFLQRIIIEGNILTRDQESVNKYETSSTQGYKLTEALSDKLGMARNIFGNSRRLDLWDKKPVKIATSALGLTLGVKALGVIASMFGPWGLLFGAFAVGGAVMDYKKNNRR